MKTMIMTDLISLKSSAVQIFVLVPAISVFMAFAMGNAYVIAPVIGLMVPFYGGLLLPQVDERNGWERIRLALPLSRKQTIQGRYVGLFLMTAISIVVGLVLFFLVTLLVPVLARYIALNETLVEYALSPEWQAILLSTAVPFACALFYLSIILPVATKLGMSKATRFIPTMLFFLVICSIPTMDMLGVYETELVLQFFFWATTTSGTLTICVVLFVTALILYSLSYFLSNRFYQSREF